MQKTHIEAANNRYKAIIDAVTIEKVSNTNIRYVI